MNRLSRQWARRIQANIYVGGVFFLLLRILHPFWGRSLDHWANVLLLAYLLLVLYLYARHLRCPHCGKGWANPWQKPGERCFCPRCGGRLLFDDDPGEGPEE